jgi:cobalamin biosynthetic protein CobC
MAMARRMTQEESTGSADKFRRHGGRLADAMRAWPDAPHPWIDLSTGINPIPWQPPAHLLFDPAPLPDVADLATLEASAACHFGVAPARVAAVPGSEVALRLLRAVGLPFPLVAVSPSYGTHGKVADNIVDGAAIAHQSGGTLLLANPNNPDGRTLLPADLREIASRQRATGGWLVIDEAFADANPGTTVLPIEDAEAPVIVMRSFGKFFGLAGVRLGFVTAPPNILGRFRQMLGDWPVSAQAISWGTEAYADARWIAETRVALATRAARLDELLKRHGLQPIGDSPLFRLVEHPDAQDIFVRLARAGILTRPFASNARWLRFGLPGNDEAFDRLDRALANG